MKQLVLYIFLFVCCASTAQNVTMTPKDTLIQNDFSLYQAKKALQIQEHKETIYYLIQRSWVANQEPSYATVGPYTTTVGDRRIPLIDGEGGENNISVLEANLNLVFPLFFGREIRLEDNKRPSTVKRHRVSLNYNGNFRMSNDTSKPILPGSHKVGFSWHINLYNNYTGSIFKDDESMAKINSSTKNLKFVNLLIKIHHYSNGQAPGFFFPSDSLPINERRNSYADGDFSTNYLYTQLVKGWYNEVDNNNSSLHQIGLAYRLDLGTETSIFSYSQQQEKSYGRHRFLASYDYRTERIGKKIDWHLRGELGYIAGNLENFLANLTNDNRKFRLNVRGLVEFSPKAHRAVGYLFFIYYGRDYLNIRYDDIVLSAQIGVTLNLDKFFMPKMNY